MIVLNIDAECLTNRRKYQEGKIKARNQRSQAMYILNRKQLINAQ